jgi:chromosome segregation ATPase
MRGSHEELRAQSADYMTRKTALEAELRALIERLERELATAQSAATASESELRSQLVAVTAAVLARDTSIAALEKQLAQEQSTSAQAASTLADLRLELGRAAAGVESLTGEVAAVRASAQTREAELQSHLRQHADQSTRAEQDLQTEVKRLRTTGSEAQQSIAALQAQISCCQADLAAVRSDSDAQLAALQTERDRLAAELAQERSTSAGLLDRFKKAVAEVEAMRDSHEELRAQSADLMTRKMALEAQLRAQIASLESQLGTSNL